MISDIKKMQQNARAKLTAKDGFRLVELVVVFMKNVYVMKHIIPLLVASRMLRSIIIKIGVR